MSGASTAGKSYTSGMTTDRKQPRSLKPNPDRDEQMKMFDTLVNFLKTNAPHISPPEAKRFFASVSTSESSRIFEFLISRLLPGFKFTKLETSVPDALTQLEYPYIRSVTRSALVSVTTRSAAVGLLVIFDWLVEFINEAENPEDDEMKELDDPDELLSDLHKKVILFREGAKEASKESFNKLYPTCDLRSIEDELNQVREESLRLKQSLEDNDELELELGLMFEDLEKWKDYYEKIKTYMESKHDIEKEELQYISKITIQNEELSRRGEKLDFDMKNHELSTGELERLEAAKDRLESELSLKSTQLKDSESKAHQLENDHKKVLNELENTRSKKISDLKELLEVYATNPFDIESKQWAERKAEIQEWICRLNQAQIDDIAYNYKLKRELSLFRQKLRGTESGLETELAASLLSLESECDKLKSAIEDYPKSIQKLRENLQAKTNELGKVESERQLNVSRLSELRAREDQMRQELERTHNQNVTNISRDITIKQRTVEEFLRGNAEITQLNQKYRTTLQKQIYYELSGILANLKKNAASWKSAQAISEKNNEIVRKALKRQRRLQNK